MAAIAFFECARCGHQVSGEARATVCPVDGGLLLVRYELGAAKREDVGAAAGIWRYGAVLTDAAPVSLGEGGTPMVASRRRANVWVKDEGASPAARGMALVVAMAREHGVRHLAIAAAGDAASALAAYAAVAGIAAHVWVPQDLALASQLECEMFGADVRLVDGTVADCARRLGEVVEKQQVDGLSEADVWCDVSALREPFRVEGEKTLGYELVEQMGWEFPEVVVYPGEDAAAGLIAMGKAFEEMEQMGWVRGARPRMYVVQELGVSEAEVMVSLRGWAEGEGMLLSLEGAAGVAAYEKLLGSGEIKAGERVVVVNTGSGVRDAERIAKAVRLRRLGELPKSLPVGGIITPV